MDDGIYYGLTMFLIGLGFLGFGLPTLRFIAGIGLLSLSTYIILEIWAKKIKDTKAKGDGK